MLGDHAIKFEGDMGAGRDLLCLALWHWHRILRRVYFYFYEIFIDSMLATRRIGEQIFSCLQFASCAHNVASEVSEMM